MTVTPRPPERGTRAAPSVITGPMDVLDQGRDGDHQETPHGAQCGLWQAGAHIGCEIVNEPNALLRNDLVTAEPGPARVLLRRGLRLHVGCQPGHARARLHVPAQSPDGHEIGGIAGDPKATKIHVGGPCSRWTTPMRTARRAVDAGGTSAEPYDMIYARVANITDPFGTEFSVITRPGG